ncbi:hypothetical protein CDV31_001802 [Fusarium ambrosium]|uniref:C2H2-type domain-containing protein n=1 Tax=Fusarium ambrosium TaxID=131363 RepID=A0A428UYQ3_9HYPO|nr:hypothetical protein CDV31_001802 [Fusarium ambrosium]
MSSIPPDQSSPEPIYHASRACLALFDEYMTDMSLSEQSLALVGELRGEFKTWAAYIGSFAVPRASLDARLVSHSDIRDMVLDLLMVLEQNLTWARKAQLEGREQAEEEADVSLGLPTARSTIERLFILAVSIRRSARQPPSVNQKPHSSGNADSSCLLLLKTRYPNARKSLLDQIAQSVHARGASLQYLRSHNRKLAHEREPSTHSCEDSMEEDIRPLGEDLVPAKHIEGGTNTELQTDPSSFSPSTVIRQNNRTMLSVKPSRSLVSTGSTVKDMVGDELPYPPMPKPENLTGRVICTICSEPMDIYLLTEDRWKAHVDADLHPYVCISEQCKEPLKFFQQKQDWVEHMQTRHTLEWAQKIHTEVWQCDIGHSEAKYFDQKDHYLVHLKEQHDGQFTSSQIQGRARRSKKTATREPFVCPLCDCVPDDIEHIVDEKPYSKLTTHIRRHLKYISFFSLSYLGVDFGDSGSIAGSSSDDNEKRASRSSHSLIRLKDVSLSDIPETEIIGHSRVVQGEVFPDVPLDVDDSDWSFIPRVTLETNWDMLQKGFGSKNPVPESRFPSKPPLEALKRRLELQNKQPSKPSVQVPTNDMMLRGVSSFHKPTISTFVAIAIDFGTVYSSVSYALSTAADLMYNITEYPGFQSGHGDATQVPTILDPKTRSWGYQVEPYMEMPIKWLKLLLLKEDEIQDEEIRSWRTRESRRLQEVGIPAVSVVSIFLRKLWSHTLDQIKVALAIRWLPLKVAITVPAIWPHYAKRAMRQAAQMAGILDERDAGETSLTLVQEPEAAALHCLREMPHPEQIKEGDSFVVCHAGGSSIDVVTYLVKSIKPFRVKECVMGSGKFAGAILIDGKFVQHLSSKNFKLKQLKPDELWDLMMRWETTHKRVFGARKDQHLFSYSSPARSFSTWERLRGKTSFPISRAETTLFFRETLDSIQSLINEQLVGVQRPKYVFLTGGLSGSPYIFETLRDSHAAITIIRSEWRSSAVALGALGKLLLDGARGQAYIGVKQQNSLNGFPEVTARKSRYSYGVAVKRNIATLSDYDPKQDKGEEIERRSTVYLRDITYAVAQIPEWLEFDIVYSAFGAVHNRLSPEVKHLGRLK